MNICAVCKCGWIIKGERYDWSDGMLSLQNASVVRRWNNGKGIGGIAKAENKDEYTLDYIGNVDIMESNILFTISCEW